MKDEAIEQAIPAVLSELVDEIRAIKVEYGFRMRWDLIEMYHRIGVLLLSHRDTISLVEVSNLTGISERNLYRAQQFAEKFTDLALLPEGKNTSWHMVVNKYLPENTQEEKECNHVPIVICAKCRIVLDKPKTSE